MIPCMHHPIQHAVLLMRRSHRLTDSQLRQSSYKPSYSPVRLGKEPDEEDHSKGKQGQIQQVIALALLVGPVQLSHALLQGCI